MKLFCVRHGETAWNVLRLVQGSSDIELTPRGIEQAETFANTNALFKSLTFDGAYTSDLKRALQTAEILCQSKPGLIAKPVANLRERFLGDFEGQPLKDMIHKLGDWEKLPEDERWTTSVYGGETFQNVLKRATSYMKTLSAEHGNDCNLLLVTHSDVLRALYLHGTKKHPIHQMVGYHNLGYLVLEMDQDGNYKVLESHGEEVLG